MKPLFLIFQPQYIGGSCFVSDQHIQIITFQCGEDRFGFGAAAGNSDGVVHFL